jgi:hypothetical protein
MTTDFSGTGSRVGRGHRTGISIRLLVAIIFVAAAVIMVSLATTGVPPSSGLPSSQGTPDVTPASGSLDCNAAGNPSPSALYVNLYEPKENLSSGGKIVNTMEFAVVNYTAADLGISVYFPTVDFTFPLSPTGNYTLAISPQTLKIAGAGWTNGADTNRSATLSGGLHFPSGGKTRLSTQKVAIQANVPYGQLTLEFRWMWTLDQPNGTVLKSPWSVPSSKWGGGVQLPSIFYPAQYIEFLSGPGGGQSVTIGTTYSATLGGPVGGQYYFLEMEDGAGSVVRSHGTTLPANVTSGNVTIPVLNYDNYLSPGLYLVHIHDACGAILYNKLIKAVYAPSVTITFYLQPGSCGPMTFNGTSFANGTTGTFVPSPTPYLFTVPKCAGYEFGNWSDTGGLHISSSDHLVVSYDGTFTITYKPS